MIAYLDAAAGISGDMFLGTLVDAGWSIDQLRAAIGLLKLPADEWAVEARSVMKGTIRATLVEVQARETEIATSGPLAKANPVQRRLDDIRRIIEASELAKGVQAKAIAVFTRLAQAEAKVHGTTPDQIHFHEVGAIDAIIDIVGTVAGLQALGIEKLYASPLPLGEGWTKIAHGQIPLPAPATLEILAAAGAATCAGPGPGELVTPTGAALVAELATFGQPPMKLQRIGVGAGQRNCKWPNVARLWIGEAGDAGPLVQLETNIDDMNPQLYAAVSEKLFAAGAKDVWFTPIQMKKNRPAILLSVLGAAAQESELTRIILRETTTLGVRVHVVHHRHEVRREVRTVTTAYGELRVKMKWMGQEAVGASPEYDDCVARAAAANVPVRLVYEAGVVAAQSLLATVQASGRTT
jgi:pyridinium-3,5-bisthiocarboxylic acid mononucleotide nickel chelatase